MGAESEKAEMENGRETQVHLPREGRSRSSWNGSCPTVPAPARRKGLGGCLKGPHARAGGSAFVWQQMACLCDSLWLLSVASCVYILHQVWTLWGWGRERGAKGTRDVRWCHVGLFKKGVRWDGNCQITAHVIHRKGRLRTSVPRGGAFWVSGL
jgi:hypothetical protein